MKFEDYLRQHYNLGEKSVKDYVGRLNGLLTRGIYKGELHLTSKMEASINREYKENSRKNYLLTIKYYIEFLEKKG